MDSVQILPPPSNLSPFALSFLNAKFRTTDTVVEALTLVSHLQTHGSDLDQALIELNRRLGAGLVAYASFSGQIHGIFDDVNAKLNALTSTCSSSFISDHGARGEKKFLEELPTLAMEVARLETVRVYAGEICFANGGSTTATTPVRPPCRLSKPKKSFPTTLFNASSRSGPTRSPSKSDENREFLAKLDGLVPMLVGLLGNVDTGVGFLESVVSALDSVMSKIEDREQLKKSIVKSHNNCLDSLLLVLQQGSTNSKIRSARILKFIVVNVESKVIIAEKEGMITELLKSISPDKDAALIENGLSCLVAISTPRRNKLKVIHLGAVKILSRLLSLGTNSSVSVTEKALKLLETVSSTKEGRSEISEDPSCVAAILHKDLESVLANFFGFDLCV